jgi:aspartyl-tRNA(Asn)/glutamyl-tRNA(Gln) amidotransferase subunit B
MVQNGTVSSRGAKEVLSLLAAVAGGDPEAIAKEKGFVQIVDREALRAAVLQVLADHHTVAEDYRKGKTAALQFLVGQGMKATRGAGSPDLIRELLISELEA